MANVEIRRSGAIAVVMLNRPEVLNVLSRSLIADLSSALDDVVEDPAVHVVVLTGAKAFCAGADIAEMASMGLQTVLNEDFSGCCERLAKCEKPVVAAVERFALGGGCELVEMCDIVVAAEDASFGHPEITLGTISGAGGTQRLARAVGRARAMDLVLTGRTIDAREAERIGLISRVVESAKALDEAVTIAAAIAGRFPRAALFAKEAVDQAVSVGLDAGLRLERRLFHLSFATGDFQEGMERHLSRRAKK